MSLTSGCGVCSPAQYSHSIMTRIRSGLLSTKETIRMIATDNATAKNEHALRAGLTEIEYEIKDNRLYSPTYKMFFDDLIT